LMTVGGQNECVVKRHEDFALDGRRDVPVWTVRFASSRWIQTSRV
jgi:hypothetical protein